MSVTSLQEEPPEVRTSIHSLKLVSPTPRFSASNKFRPSNQTCVNKENKINTSLLPKIKMKNGVFNYGSTVNGGLKAYVWGSGKDGRCGNGKESSEKLPN